MKLEKFKKNKRLRNTLLTLGAITALGGGLLVYRTYALYQEEKEYNVIKGIVPDFGYDVKLAIQVNGAKANDAPARGLYKTEIKCNNEATGEWDYNAWNLKINNASEGTKCNITFTSGLSDAEYKEYLEAGVNARRNTYRGKDITYLYTNQQLYKQIEDCTFDDIYVGDYIKTTNNSHTVTWLIADINNYLHSGYTDLQTCHATIIPAIPLKDAQMNDSDTTANVYKDKKLTAKDNTERSNLAAYVGSKMKQETLPDDILKNYIEPVFGENIITYTNLLADQFDGSRSDQFGVNWGASSGWAWYESKLDLMSEVNVYGSTVWSSSGYDIGIDNRQYAIFKLKPEFINSYGSKRFNYWLKAVAASANFAHVYYLGGAGTHHASASFGVRPRFLIK